MCFQQPHRYRTSRVRPARRFTFEGLESRQLMAVRIDQTTYLDGGYGTNRLVLGYNAARNLTAVNFI